MLPSVQVRLLCSHRFFHLRDATDFRLQKRSRRDTVLIASNQSMRSGNSWRYRLWTMVHQRTPRRRSWTSNSSTLSVLTSYFFMFWGPHLPLLMLTPGAVRGCKRLESLEWEVWRTNQVRSKVNQAGLNELAAREQQNPSQLSNFRIIVSVCCMFQASISLVMDTGT